MKPSSLRQTVMTRGMLVVRGDEPGTALSWRGWGEPPVHVVTFGRDFRPTGRSQFRRRGALNLSRARHSA